MNVSIILPTYNRAHIIRECIDSVISQTSKNWELIILDDCSHDNTEEIGREYQIKDKRIHYSRNTCRLNLLANKNKGVSLSNFPLILIIEDDLILEQNCVEQLILAYIDLSKKYLVGAIAPKLTSLTERKNQSSLKPFFMNKISGEIWNNYDIPGEHPIETFTLHASSLIPKKVITDVGGFSSGEYIGNCFREETDFYFRIRKKGYHLFFNPNSSALHKNEKVGGCKLNNQLKNHLYCIYNHYIFLRKFFGYNSYIMIFFFIIQHVYHKVLLEAIKNWHNDI